MASWIEYTEPIWRGLQMRELDVDEAYLVLSSTFYDKTYLYSLSDECYTCPYAKVQTLHQNRTENPLKLNVAHPTSFKIFDEDVGKYAFDNVSAMCTLQTSMQEFGVYNLSVRYNGTCELVTDKAGVNVNRSLILVIILCVLLQLSIWALKKWRSSRTAEIAVSAGEEDNADKPIVRKRMRSLDAFRGLVIILMIFVNSGGGGYWWIEHAPWNGLHLADVVFPSFLWIMGVCIPISVKSQLSRGATKRSICRKIIWRSLKMFLIGVCLNSINGPELQNLRIMGVLQRFGVSYLIVGIIHTFFSKNEYILPQSSGKQSIFDLILLKEQILCMLAFVALSLGMMFGMSAPGCPRGYIGPGGKHNYAANPNCIGGIAGFIDSAILGDSHIYQHPTAKYVYDSKVFDPEGIFGCLLTIVQVFIGVIFGSIFIVHTGVSARLKRWIGWGIALGLLGGILCLFSAENGFIPLNKNLWSLSFVLVASAIDFLVLSAFYYIIDVREIWNGYPLAESGMNAIVLYVGHTVLHKMLPWHWRIGAMNTHFVLLLECTWNTLLWIGIAVYLDGIQFYYSL